MICGSMTFAKEMIEAKNDLERMGNDVIIPSDATEIANGDHNHDDLEADYRHCVENDILRQHFNFIEKSDAVVVLNYPKNGIEGYIGAASLMEIGLAYHLKKKLFLLYPLPHHSYHRWAHEVRIIRPVILNGNLNEIK